MAKVIEKNGIVVGVKSDGCDFRPQVSRKSQTDGSVSAPTVRTDPVLEAIARKLFGITSVPIAEQSRMIKRAAKAGAEALRKQNGANEPCSDSK